MKEQTAIELKKEENAANLQKGNQLLLLQAINSFEHGLKCLEWMSDLPNECTKDSYMILTDRFEYFKECALDTGDCDFLIINKVENELKGVQRGYEEKLEVKEQLSRLRQAIIEEKQAS
ncbi:hypothetical protein ACFFU1_14195 [Algibacter miyuki]|uniref:Uncharacterized protein n=1 Tax=Algibacter miyuki TaxID=1306933 RepID=A0ABV5H2C7_9FLAO|nr:hypothetical protein [Algibacter miyuki]MDN3664458.1 hypothetical protein [Algibacter miyuki]MDN3665325.1 hypothetical protein [Algibacter miyuki]